LDEFVVSVYSVGLPAAFNISTSILEFAVFRHRADSGGVMFSSQEDYEASVDKDQIDRNAATNSARDFLVRPGSVSDVPAILECLRSAFEPFREQYTPQAFLDTVMTEEAVFHRLESMSLFVAVDGEGHVGGTIGGSLICASEGHLRGMGVHPQWQGCGVALLLLQQIEKVLFGEGCTRISLDTTAPLHRAMRFYQKHGYRRTSRLTPYFGMELIEHVKERVP
jgi:GNAT superfamily N-acetyltransferase